MVSVAGRDSLNFFSRRETKYELDVASARELRRVVAGHLPRYEFRSGRPSTYVTTIYFDTDLLKFYERASLHYDDNLKFRVKEYYYKTDDGTLEILPYCLVELKERKQGRVGKRRIRIPKELLHGLLNGDDIWKKLQSLEDGIEFDGSHEIYHQIRRYLNSDEIHPHGVINYRRSVYQENEDELRITFDDELEVFEPLDGLYDSCDSLTKGTLGTPRRLIDMVIMEIKWETSYPPWLESALTNLPPKKMSKFTTSINLLGCDRPDNGAELKDGEDTNGDAENIGRSATDDTPDDK
jgi:hypothetical protein